MIGSMIVFALTAVAPPVPPAATVPAVVSPAKKGQDPNRQLCRTEEVTGSHLATTRRCMAAYQWKEYDRLQREAADRAQRGAMPARAGQ